MAAVTEPAKRTAGTLHLYAADTGNDHFVFHLCDAPFHDHRPAIVIIMIQAAGEIKLLHRIVPHLRRFVVQRTESVVLEHLTIIDLVLECSVRCRIVNILHTAASNRFYSCLTERIAGNAAGIDSERVMISEISRMAYIHPVHAQLADTGGDFCAQHCFRRY